MLSQDQLADFKTNICDENRIISSLIVNQFAEYFVEPILDVGSSSGDILLSSFPSKEVVHLDRDPINHIESKPETHQFVQGDFFEYEGKVGTLFLGHVLQYIDEDLEKLTDKIINLNPRFIVTVTNKNDDLLGEIIKTLDSKSIPHNAEQDISNFSDQFVIEKKVPFTATMQADSLDALADYLGGVILDNEKSEVKEAVKKILDINLSEPVMTINETVRAFKNII